jgi:hypothetical protein
MKPAGPHTSTVMITDIGTDPAARHLSATAVRLVRDAAGTVAPAAAEAQADSATTASGAEADPSRSAPRMWPAGSPGGCPTVG